MRDYVLRRYHRRRFEWIARLGGKCEYCGTQETSLLQFHHKNPDEKTFTIGKVLAGASEARVAAEMVKCGLACVACHTDHHREDQRARVSARWADPDARALMIERRHGLVTQ